MELTPMQYKGFVWPHNPRTYRISYRRRVAVHDVPQGRYTMQDMGLSHRVMEGEGEFFGPDAYDQFKALASVFYLGGPGALIHPVWQSASVYFVRLALAQEPQKDYVRYTFTFWEDYGRYRRGLTAPAAPAADGTARAGGQVHTVADGETLWAVAQRYRTTVEALLALNPQLSNPNAVAAGQRLRVG